MTARRPASAYHAKAEARVILDGIRPEQWRRLESWCRTVILAGPALGDVDAREVVSMVRLDVMEGIRRFARGIEPVPQLKRWCHSEIGNEWKHYSKNREIKGWMADRRINAPRRYEPDSAMYDGSLEYVCGPLAKKFEKGLARRILDAVLQSNTGSPREVSESLRLSERDFNTAMRAIRRFARANEKEIRRELAIRRDNQMPARAVNGELPPEYVEKPRHVTAWDVALFLLSGRPNEKLREKAAGDSMCSFNPPVVRESRSEENNL